MTGYLIKLLQDGPMDFDTILDRVSREICTLRKPDGSMYSVNLRRSLKMALSANGIFACTKIINNDVWEVLNCPAKQYVVAMIKKFENQKTLLSKRKRKFIFKIDVKTKSLPPYDVRKNLSSKILVSER